jgi:hypothetical protein
MDSTKAGTPENLGLHNERSGAREGRDHREVGTSITTGALRNRADEPSSSCGSNVRSVCREAPARPTEASPRESHQTLGRFSTTR